MIIVSTGNLDLTERMCTLLQYHCAYENKKWDVIFGEKKKINEIIRIIGIKITDTKPDIAQHKINIYYIYY